MLYSCAYSTFNSNPSHPKRRACLFVRLGLGELLERLGYQESRCWVSLDEAARSPALEHVMADLQGAHRHRETVRASPASVNLGKLMLHGVSDLRVGGARAMRSCAQFSTLRGQHRAVRCSVYCPLLLARA